VVVVHDYVLLKLRDRRTMMYGLAIMSGPSRSALVFVLLAGGLAHATAAHGGDALQASGFADLRGGSHASVPLDGDAFSAQVQAGVDWSPSPHFRAHLHLLARTDDGGSRRGRAGVPEAYLEAHLPAGGGRFKVRGGAFFLPTSRENVDDLWENPYAVTSSALNTWFGQELRPIGLDVSWSRGGATIGATVFRGNDTLGALPVSPGWSLSDRWTVLGQKVPAGEDYASVSAETDGRLGWSARGGWSTTHLSALYTHVDNRSDGLLHGDLGNWRTGFEVVGVAWTGGAWTVAGETGWGPTDVFFPGGTFRADLRASYVLVSRLLGGARVTGRFDEYRAGETHGHAVTLTGLWMPVPALTLGIELSAGGGEARGLADARRYFALR
jgi:hypothetical protein